VHSDTKAAGLSYITVSRALRQPETVRADTREKIQKTSRSSQVLFSRISLRALQKLSISKGFECCLPSATGPRKPRSKRFGHSSPSKRYLIEQGYNDIVLVSGASENIDQFADRRRGFVDTMRDAGREVTPETIVQFENPATIESGGPLISTVLSRKSPPDAVMFLAELPAQGAMLWCLSNAVRVPEDIAIAGFGDLSHSALLPVPMTTVQIRGRAIGERTAEIICKGKAHELIARRIRDQAESGDCWRGSLCLSHAYPRSGSAIRSGFGQRLPLGSRRA